MSAPTMITTTYREIEKVVYTGTITITGHTVDMTTGTSLLVETCCAALNRSMIMSSTTTNDDRMCRIEQTKDDYYFKFLLPRRGELKQILCLDYEPTAPNRVLEIKTRNKSVGHYYKMARVGDDIYLPKEITQVRKFNDNEFRSENSLKNSFNTECTKMTSLYWDVYYFKIPASALGNNSGGFQQPFSRTFFPFAIKWSHADKPSNIFTSFISYFNDSPNPSNKQDLSREPPTTHESNVRKYVSNMMAGNILGDFPVKKYKITEDFDELLDKDNNTTFKSKSVFKETGEFINPTKISMAPYNFLDPFPQYNFSPLSANSIDFMDSKEKYTKLENFIAEKDKKINDKLKVLFDKIRNYTPDDQNETLLKFFVPFSDDETKMLRNFSYNNLTDEQILQRIIQSCNFFEEHTIARSDYPIYLPIASTRKELNGTVRLMSFYPEQCAFTKTMMEHIHAISSSLVDSTNTANKFEFKSVAGVDSFYTYRGKDYGYIKVYSGKKVNVDMYFTDRNFSRLMGGSNTAAANSPGLTEFINNVGNEKPSLASFGFGCLSTIAIKFAYKKICEADGGEIWSLSNRNGVFNELIGITSQELDERIFNNANEFYSNDGSNKPLPECIYNKYKILYSNKTKGINGSIALVNSITEEYVKIMNSIFKSYIEYLKTTFAEVDQSNLFVNKEIHISSQTDDGDGEIRIIKKERSCFVRILQIGCSFMGVDKRGFVDGWQAIKIVNYMDHVTNTMKSNVKVQPEDKDFTPWLYPEGGDTLALLFKDKDETNSESTLEYISRDNRDIRSPYGYVAKNLVRMSRIVKNHLSFFLPGAHQYEQSTKDRTATLVKIRTPDYIKYPTISMGIGSNPEAKRRNFTINGPQSSEIVYYIEDSSRSGNKEKRNAALKLSELKQIWINYMKTPHFFVTCGLPERTTNDINERNQRNFAIKFAEFLAIKYGKFYNGFNTSIYDIIQSRRISENEMEDFIFKVLAEERAGAIVKEPRGEKTFVYYYPSVNTKISLAEENKNSALRIDKRAFAEIIDAKKAFLNKNFPTIYKNFVQNCDTAFAVLRTIDLWTFYKNYSRGDKEVKNFYPNIYINGYLLSNDFEKKQNIEAESLVTRFDYLALSASVYFSINPPSKILGSKELFNEGLLSDPQLRDKYKDDFMGPLTKDTVIETVYANVSDIPMYAYTQNGKAVFKTLNGRFSPITSSMYYFARAITSSSDEYKHTFCPLHGVPYSLDRTGIAKIDTTDNSQYDVRNAKKTKISDDLIINYKEGKGKRRVETKQVSEPANIDSIDLGSAPQQQTIWGQNVSFASPKKDIPVESRERIIDEYHKTNLIQRLTEEYDKKINQEKQDYETKREAIEEKIKSLKEKKSDNNIESQIRDLQRELNSLQRPNFNLRLIERSKIISEISVFDRSFLEELSPDNNRRIEGDTIAALLSSTFSHEGKTFRTSDNQEYSSEKFAQNRSNEYIRKYRKI